MCHTPKPEPVTPQSLLGLWRGIQVRSRVLTIIHIIRSLMACTKRHISLFCVCTQSIRSTPDFSRANGYSTSRRHPSRCGTTGAGGSQRALDLAQICSTPVAIGLGTLGKCCAGSFTGDTVCGACMRAYVCKRQVTAPNDATKSWKATVSTLQDPATGRQEVWLVLQSGPDSGKTVKALYEIGPNGPETQHLLLACGEPDVASKALAPKDFDTPMVRGTTPCTLNCPSIPPCFVTHHYCMEGDSGVCPCAGWCKVRRVFVVPMLGGRSVVLFPSAYHTASGRVVGTGSGGSSPCNCAGPALFARTSEILHATTHRMTSVKKCHLSCIVTEVVTLTQLHKH